MSKLFLLTTFWLGLMPKAMADSERTLEIELGKIPGAMLYQVEVESFDQSLEPSRVYDVSPSKPVLRARLLPGRYALSTRSSDGLHMYGAWSQPMEIWLASKTNNGFIPADDAKIQQQSNFRSTINFRWPKIPGAGQYAFVLKGKDGREDRTTITPELWLALELDVNAEYHWSVVPLAPDEKINSDAAQARLHAAVWNKFSLVAGQKGLHDVTINVEPVAGAQKYIFEFRSVDRAGMHELPTTQESPTAAVTLSLLAGAWEVRVRTLFPDGKLSEWSSRSRFDVAYPPMKLISPRQDEVVDADDDKASSVNLRWTALPEVDHYLVYLYDESGQFIKSFSSKNAALTIRLPHAHTYQWLVLAHNHGQTDLPPPPLSRAAGRFSIGTYIPLALSASEEPSNLYGWVRYWTSVSDYNGSNQDWNSLVQQKLYTGSGELAFGYWQRVTHFGWLAHAEVTGFTIGSTTYNYANGGLDFGYRQVFSGGARLRMWLGATYRESPELLRDVYLPGAPIDFKRARSYGPQAQISYMDDFSFAPAYGWHAYTTAYYGVGDLGSPNRLPEVPEWTFTAGVFLTYKYSEDQKWMLGYAYRQENLRYRSSVAGAPDNTSMSTGNYLNLSVEFGLAEHPK